jgi:hypothetical protein
LCFDQSGARQLGAPDDSADVRTDSFYGTIVSAAGWEWGRDDAKISEESF